MLEKFGFKIFRHFIYMCMILYQTSVSTPTRFDFVHVTQNVYNMLQLYLMFKRWIMNKVIYWKEKYVENSYIILLVSYTEYWRNPGYSIGYISFAHCMRVWFKFLISKCAYHYPEKRAHTMYIKWSNRSAVLKSLVYLEAFIPRNIKR